MSTFPPADPVDGQSGGVGIHVDIAPLSSASPSPAPSCLLGSPCDILAQTGGTDPTFLIVAGIGFLIAGAMILTGVAIARRRSRARR